MEESKQQNKLNSRLLLVSPPFPGHQNPVLNLATLLYSKGFSITIIQTPYKPINPTKFRNFNFRFLVNTLLESYNELPPSNIMEIMSCMNNSCTEPFRDCISQILNDVKSEPETEPIVALIADSFCNFVIPIANSFNLPRLTFMAGSISSLMVHSSLSHLREKGYFNNQDISGTDLEEPILEFPPLKLKDIPELSSHKSFETYVQQIQSSQGVICNTFEELENFSLARLQRTFTIPIFTIGPLHTHSPIPAINASVDDQSSISWLSTQAPNSVLYVSFGSVSSMNKDEFLEVAWGLLESKVPFLWVVRQDSVKGMHTNEIFTKEYLHMVGDKGLVVQWAPQLEVLAHPAIGGFWTHNGWNSTLESISEGVPMLCQPFMFDQHMNARYVCDGWNIGLPIKSGAKREEIARVIRKLMLEEEGEEIRRKVKNLKEKASLCIKEGGSSHNFLEKLSKYLLSF